MRNKNKKLPYRAKKKLVWEWLERDPTKSNHYIAAEVGCHSTYVGTIRRAFMQVLPSMPPTTPYPAPELKHEPQISSTGSVSVEVEGETADTDVDTLLATRHRQYGTFEELSKVATDIKGAIRDGVSGNGYTLEPDQLEALDMIATKVARAACGDPNNIDTWRDLAGYAMLVVKRLEGTKL